MAKRKRRIRPVKPVDRGQKVKTVRPIGAKKWIKGHWRYNYSTRKWTWVEGHWSK